MRGSRTRDDRLLVDELLRQRVGKGDHRHMGRMESNYGFVSVDRLH